MHLGSALCYLILKDDSLDYKIRMFFPFPCDSDSHTQNPKVDHITSFSKAEYYLWLKLGNQPSIGTPNFHSDLFPQSFREREVDESVRRQVALLSTFPALYRECREKQHLLSNEGNLLNSRGNFGFYMWKRIFGQVSLCGKYT